MMIYKKERELSKEGFLETDPLMEEDEYDELKEQGLVPDRSEVAVKKFNELMERGPEFTSDELYFLGRMDLKALGDKYEVAAYEYMDL